MKGTEKIIAHIQADAKAQADAILAQTELQCAEIRKSYEAKAKERYAEKIRQGVKTCQDNIDSVERINQMEARKAILALKQEMVSKSFDTACRMLSQLPQDKYVELLAKLAVQASTTGDEEIVLNARDRKAVGQAVVDRANALLSGGKLSLSDSTGDFAGGLILRRGSIEANCTIELLVELCRGDMSAQLAKVLFE
ncbi:MAG TPA: V-type ATP synthase subunit E [Candidatus Limivicinus faecipullorum]|nr:V-type ATP synthase subunit E [Candidatus Limivicinus faecipullorum]